MTFVLGNSYYIKVLIILQNTQKGGVDGVGREWVGSLDQGLEGWGGVMFV